MSQVVQRLNIGHLLCRIGFHRWTNRVIVHEVPLIESSRFVGVTLIEDDYNKCSRPDCPRYGDYQLVNQERRKIAF